MVTSQVAVRSDGATGVVSPETVNWVLGTSGMLVQTPQSPAVNSMTAWADFPAAAYGPPAKTELYTQLGSASPAAEMLSEICSAFSPVGTIMMFGPAASDGRLLTKLTSVQPALSSVGLTVNSDSVSVMLSCGKSRLAKASLSCAHTARPRASEPDATRANAPDALINARRCIVPLLRRHRSACADACLRSDPRLHGPHPPLRLAGQTAPAGSTGIRRRAYPLNKVLPASRRTSRSGSRRRM